MSVPLSEAAKEINGSRPLLSDPTEHVDIAAAQPAIATQLRARLLALNATAFSPSRGKGQAKLKCAVGVQRYGGFWGPFLLE